MARQATLPDHENLPRTRQVIVRLIEEHMAESGTDQGTQENVQEETGQMFLRSLLVSIDLDHDQIAQHKTQREKQTVPAERERTDSENFGIYNPNQVGQLVTLTGKPVCGEAEG